MVASCASAEPKIARFLKLMNGTIPPNTTLPAHWHPGEEFLYLLEGKATLLRGGEEEMVMEGVDLLEPEDGQLRMKDIFGEEMKLEARIKGFSLVDHKIILEPL